MNQIKAKIYERLKWSEKYTKTDMVYLTKSISWISIGNGISSLASFVLVVVFGNLVSKHDYGVYQYVISIAGILSIPTLAGMNTALTSAIAQGFEGNFKEVLKTRIRWGILACLGSIGTAIYYYVNGNDTLAMSFFAISIFLPFMDSFSVYISYIEGKKLFKKSALYSSLITIFRVGTLVGAIMLTDNIILIVLTYIVTTTLARGMILLIILKSANLNKKIDRSSITYGKHLSFMRILSSAIVSIDNILLFHFLGAAQLAIYSFAKSPVTKISGMITPVASLAYPKFSENTKEVLKKTLPKKAFLLFLMMTMVTSVYILLAPFLFKIALPQYLDSVFYSQLFALSLLFLPQKVLAGALTAQKQQKALYVLNIVNPILRIILLILLLPTLGITGVIISFLIPLAINGMMVFYFFMRM